MYLFPEVFPYEGTRTVRACVYVVCSYVRKYNVQDRYFRTCTTKNIIVRKYLRRILSYESTKVLYFVVRVRTK